jgi:hypothetical protein
MPKGGSVVIGGVNGGGDRHDEERLRGGDGGETCGQLSIDPSAGLIRLIKPFLSICLHETFTCC